MLQISASVTESCRKSCTQLVITTATRGTTSQNPKTLLNPNVEECLGQVQILQPEEAITKILGDFDSFHQRFERLGNVLRLLSIETGHLHDKGSQSSIPGHQRNFQVRFGLTHHR